MPTFRDLTGNRYGYLVVMQRVEGYPTRYLVKCDCGVEKILKAVSFAYGDTNSCGCMKTYLQSKNSRNATHRMSDTPEYKSWLMMHTRCSNPNYTHYDYYGGREIFIDPYWNSFENFYDDMGSKPTLHHTLDRIDSNREYAGWNCRWATREEQVDNRRNKRTFLFNGRLLTLKQIARDINSSRERLYNYIYRGYSIDDAIEACRDSKRI